LQVVRQDVEQELRVRVRVDVSVRVGIEELAESRGVDEVTVLTSAWSDGQDKAQLTWAKTIPYGELT
jgi:hypothetical protein